VFGSIAILFVFFLVLICFVKPLNYKFITVVDINMMPFEKITICLEEIMKRFNIRDINLTSNQLRKTVNDGHYTFHRMAIWYISVTLFLMATSTEDIWVWPAFPLWWDDKLNFIYNFDKILCYLAPNESYWFSHTNKWFDVWFAHQSSTASYTETRLNSGWWGIMSLWRLLYILLLC